MAALMEMRAVNFPLRMGQLQKVGGLQAGRGARASKALLLKSPPPLRDLSFDKVLPADNVLLCCCLLAERGAEGCEQSIRMLRAQGSGGASANVGARVTQLHPFVNQAHP